MKTIWTHFSTEKAKIKSQNYYYKDISINCPLDLGLEKYVFHALAFLVSEIFPINSVPLKPSIVNNFWHSSLSPSWNPSFESSGGGLFKNAYFYCVKVARFRVTESCDVSNVKKEVFELTLVLKMPKIQSKK